MDIKSWLIKNNGMSELKVKFNKNVFTPVEQAIVDVEINNSKCKLQINKIGFRLVQVLRIGTEKECAFAKKIQIENEIVQTADK